MYALPKNMRTKPIVIDGEVLCFGIADDGMTMNFGLFRGVSGQWLAVPPLIDDNLTSQKVMAYGTVAEFIKAHLPVMNARLKAYTEVKGPDFQDKVACVGYDFALDLDYDGELKLNKEPPLSHAQA